MPESVWLATWRSVARRHAWPTRDDGHEIIYQVISRIGGKDGFHVTALMFQERGDVAIAEAREPIPLLHYQYTHLRIRQQLLELGAFVM
jgi:hypothetical protein